MLVEPAAVLITADAVRDGLEDEIIDDLRKLTKAHLIFRKTCQIKRMNVRLIYPQLVKRSFFSALMHNLTFGPTLLLILVDEDIYSKLSEVKGEFRLRKGQIEKSGLRLKYQGPSREELISLGYSGKELLNRQFEFRLHTADNLQETIMLCKLLTTLDELEVLKEICSQFRVGAKFDLSST